MKRCEWADSDPVMQDYYDEEWGVPVHDDRLLFEFLILEGAQAGMSWTTFVTNAKTFLEVRKQFGSFDAYIWQFVG